jgi:acyl-CoA thioesterase YciA
MIVDPGSKSISMSTSATFLMTQMFERKTRLTQSNNGDGYGSGSMRSDPLIRVTAMPSDTNPYGGVFGGWLMGQMGLACGSFVSRRTKGKALLVAADSIKFAAPMAVGDELSVYVELLKQGRSSLRLKAEAVARVRDGEGEKMVAEGEFTFVALDEAGRPREIEGA